jgi:hypothetical protein
LIRLSSTERRIRHVLFGNVLIQGDHGRTMTVTEEISIKIKERANFSNSLSNSNFYKILIE